MIIRDKFSREIRILGPHDEMFENDVAMKFFGASEIVDFLHRTVEGEFHNKATLREILGRLEGHVYTLDDEEVLRDIALHVLVGSVKIISRTERPHFATASTGGAAPIVRKEKKPPPPKPAPPLPPIVKKQLTWVEIELVDTAGKPVPGVRYRLELPDGQFQEGTLDQNGRARADDIDPGTCWITFPDHD